MSKEKSEQEIFNNFDIVISSNYARAISTAKGKVFFDGKWKFKLIFDNDNNLTNIINLK